MRLQNRTMALYGRELIRGSIPSRIVFTISLKLSFERCVIIGKGAMACAANEIN